MMKLNDLIDLEHALKVIDDKDTEIARFKIDTQEIMRINNEIRAMLLDVRKGLWDESAKGTLQPKLYSLIDRIDRVVH